MDAPTAISRILDDVASGAVAPEEALARLVHLPFTDLGYARVDHLRALSHVIPEAVYAPGKTPEQCAAVVADLLAHPGGPVVCTRAGSEQVAACTRRNPGGSVTGTGGGLSLVSWRHAPERSARVLVVTAGTADLPVAGEVCATLRAFGITPGVQPDCGVAGLHRVLASREELGQADAVVVVAGMEGALASVVAGLTPAPVVAVPTSAGYGAAMEGITAFLAMAASCAPGVTVVGIDNGFGAGCAVARLLS